MRERGYHLAGLWTPDRCPTGAFYEANGWRHDGQRKWHDRLQLDIMHYQKRLMPRGSPGSRRL